MVAPEGDARRLMAVNNLIEFAKELAKFYLRRGNQKCIFMHPGKTGAEN
jgi:hypothetical protein